MVWFVGVSRSSGLQSYYRFWRSARRLPQTRLDHLFLQSLRSLQNVRREVLQLLLGLEIDPIARTRIAQRLRKRKKAVRPRLAILLRLVPIRRS
jgi:hypothetical protein